MSNAAAEVSDLRKSFWSPRQWGLWREEIPVLRGVSFRIEEGELAALVGESGSGKTTLARCLLGLLPFEAGVVRVAGAEVARLGRRGRKSFSRAAQMVFQDPYASLNPALRVRSILAEALRVHRDLSRRETAEEVERLARSVYLPAARLWEFPASLSGGELRRVAIGRALATRARFVITDEPVAGVDPPVQVQLLELLRKIHARGGITFLVVSHDLRLVRAVAARVLVLYQGQIVEDAPAQRFFGGGALHPYSQELLECAFAAERYLSDRAWVRQAPAEPGGCPYRHRCVRAESAGVYPCAGMAPPAVQPQPGHWVMCHRWGPP